MALEDLRSTATRAAKEPRAVEVVRDSDPGQLNLVPGVWTDSPWPEVKTLLTHIDEATHSLHVLCRIDGPVDLGAHRHPNHVEEAHVIEGSFFDVIHQERITPARRFKVPAGEPHWPSYDGPALVHLIFRQRSAKRETRALLSKWGRITP